MKTKLVAALSFVLLFQCLTGCGLREPSAPTKTESSGARSSPKTEDADRSESNRTEDHAEETEESRIADEDTTDERSKDNYFHGYRCTADCSGHEAGYAWAEKHDIRDPDECGGNSQSFIEGCRAWVEENP